MDIKFKEMHDEIILVKTKHLNLYEFDISNPEVDTLNKTTCPLETRSIFGRSDLYLLHFESVKLFIEHQEKRGHRILLPRNNSVMHIVGYDPKNFEFYIYDISFKRVTRSFKVPNPNYSDEKAI